MNIDFLSPIDVKTTKQEGLAQKATIGNTIRIHSRQNGFPNLDGVSIVFFGVKEGRNAVSNYGCGKDLSNIREEFYKLFPGKWHPQIADLGDIEKGETIEDTYFAVSNLIESLLKLNLLPIVIGGSQDLTFAMYRGYDNLEQTVNLVSVDSRLDIGNLEDDLSSTSYLSKIIMKQPNNLFNYSNLGYQTYFNSQEEIDLINSLFFDAYRLGEVKNLELVEPVMRDADLVSVDIGAIKANYAFANKNTSPNGFNGEEICAVARYAGLSDKVTSFGVFEYNSSFDVNNQTAKLIAQMIWYFIEGYNFRAKDYPYTTKEKYQKFSVMFEDDDPISFYKSDRSGRWWMEINLITDNKYKRHTLIPCTYKDYEDALDQKIPERWYKAQQKLI